MQSLVGYTGFVGSNLASQNKFDQLYNSKNIHNAFGTQPDLLIYAGIPAQKFIANKFPEQDYQVIQTAIKNIQNINPKKLILISTIDVYKTPINVDETTPIDTHDLHPYGLNRYLVEQWVQNNQSLFDQHLILRLPGLFGKNLKKNFIYDFIQIIPAMLTQEKYNQLAQHSHLIKKSFALQDNGFYQCKNLDTISQAQLKQTFQQLGFTALNFTDSRARFQFYNLNHLWQHIQTALDHQIPLLNTATEPIQIAELYQYLTDQKFDNHIDRPILSYDYKTIHDQLFNGQNGYLASKTSLLEQIKSFVAEQLEQQK
jgi:hypothetical protein